MFACLFVLLVPFATAALRRHGKRAYTAKSRLHPYGKRWEFYWQFITILFIAISSFCAIDIDRVVVQSGSTGAFDLFWSASLATTQAAIWELSRNWAEIENQKFRAKNVQMALHQHEVRLTTKIHFWMPILFYMLDFFALFLTSFRPWTHIYQGNKYVATDNRFKAGAIFSVLAYLVNIWIIVNSIYAHKPDLRQFHFYTVLFSMVIILLRIVYTNYQMYLPNGWTISAYNIHANVVYLVVLGYIPTLLVLISHDVRGILMENVDKRMQREQAEAERHFQAQFKKTAAFGSTITTSDSGLARSDRAADWMTKTPQLHNHELKSFNYMIERKPSET